MSEKITFSVPPRKKGLVVKVVVDFEYGGFYFQLSKYRFEINLGYFALRLFFMNEAHYDNLNAVLNFNEICKTHSVDIEGLKSKGDKTTIG